MKQSEINASLLEYFATLSDHRVNRRKRHNLLDIIAIAICSVISGGDGPTDMELYGIAKRDWLKSFLELPNGIPSHDTFGRFFAALDPHAFHRCFLEWITAIAQLTDGRLVAIDGKTLRGSADTAAGTPPLHMVSAWAEANRLMLAQRAVDDRSNEIIAIPALVEMLWLNGAIVTIDAIGTQKTIAQAIRDKQGDYVLALKQNHPLLYQQTVALFDEHRATPERFAPTAVDQQTDAGHGRIEVRRCWSLAVAERWAVAAEWAGLQSVAMIERERHIGTEKSVERSYYLTSLPPVAATIAAAVRAHWSIENQLHWVLDVTFAEDASRIRVANAVENLTLLRKIALNLLAQEPSKGSIKGKRKRAGWDNDFLRRVLSC
jgi:predicted transposase YbfD/YdcC